MIFKKKEEKNKNKKISLHTYDVIKKPVITEKGTLLSSNSQIVFNVAIDANKKHIKNAVEKLFDVNVKKINIIVSKGKSYNFFRKRTKD